MTYIEVCRKVAKQTKVSEDTVRKVLDSMVDVAHEALVEGDEVKLKGLGTFYSKNYLVPKGTLEFGNKTDGGTRRRIRFRPFDSTNVALTSEWNERHGTVKVRK
jgi:hypothetical protein